VFGALNSVEMASLPWTMLKFMGLPGSKFFDDFLTLRMKHMEMVLADREWLAGTFSVADILMADVLRVAERFGGLDDSPACRAYVARATGRPAFAKARDDQMAHFAAGDAARA
jgi:glutathione S-transferase